MAPLVQQIRAIDAVLQGHFDAVVYWAMRTFEVSKYEIRHHLFLLMLSISLSPWVVGAIKGTLTIDDSILYPGSATFIFVLMKHSDLLDRRAEQAGMRSRMDNHAPGLKAFWWGMMFAQLITHAPLMHTLMAGCWLSQEYLRHTNPTPPARKSRQRVVGLSPQPT